MTPSKLVKKKRQKSQKTARLPGLPQPSRLELIIIDELSSTAHTRVNFVQSHVCAHQKQAQQLASQCQSAAGSQADSTPVIYKFKFHSSGR